MPRDRTVVRKTPPSRKRPANFQALRDELDRLESQSRPGARFEGIMLAVALGLLGLVGYLILGGAR